MRVLQIAPYFDPYTGGQERYIFSLSKHLVKLGHDVDVVTSRFPRGSERRQSIEGFRVYRYRCAARPLRNPITPGLLALLPDLSNYDIIHAHNEYSFGALAGSFFRSCSGVPLVLTSHIFRLFYGNPFKDRMVSMYTKLVCPKILESADAIFANSLDDKMHLSSLSPKSRHKIKLVSNAVEPERFKIQAANGIRPDIAELIADDKKRLLFVGNLLRRKGVDVLIKAVSNMTAQRDDIRLLVVGDGIDRDYFENIANETNARKNIVFLGKVSQSDLVHLYHNSTLFVLPSFGELCPTTVLEAQCCGLPVVTTDTPGIADHFSDTAALVPPGDVEALQEVILSLLADESIGEGLAQKAVRNIRATYNWDNIAEQYSDAYLSILNETTSQNNTARYTSAY
jgi:glycosyltransferase involved in cell wall biosynthesis